MNKASLELREATTTLLTIKSETVSIRSKYESMSTELKDVKQQRDSLLDTIKKKSVFEEKYYEKIQQVEKLKEDLDGTSEIF